MKTNWILVSVLIVGAAAFAQEPTSSDEPIEDPGFVISTETNLVLVPFHVTRKKDYVEGLTQGDIQLLEDGVPQEIAFFEGPGVGSVAGRDNDGERQGLGRTVPVEIILVLDVSLSVMNRSLLDIYTLKETILDGLGEGVKIGIYAFGGKMARFTEPTRDIDKLQQALEKAYDYAQGGTRLYEAVMQAARDVSQRGGDATRMLVVLSDGFPTGMQDPSKAATVANYYGVPVYPVVLGHREIVQRARTAGQQNSNPRPLALENSQFAGLNVPGAPGGRNPQQQMQTRQQESNARSQEAQMAKFAWLGDATGGRAFDPLNINNKLLRGIFKSLVRQVQAEYVVGYYPKSADEEKTPHRVAVQLIEEKKGKLYGGQRIVAH